MVVTGGYSLPLKIILDFLDVRVGGEGGLLSNRK
jgi:hypothetical protein